MFAGAQMGMPPDRVEFQYGPFGKPFVVSRGGTTPFHFNVSHSGKLVLFAFHPACEVGVDVEEVREGRDWEAVAQRVFPAEEFHNWMLLKPDERISGFFRAWTRHEAALKTLGLGFFDESGAEHEARLACFDLELPEGYQGAVGCLRWCGLAGNRIKNPCHRIIQLMAIYQIIISEYVDFLVCIPVFLV